MAVLLFFSMASTDNLDVLKTLPAWSTLITDVLVAFPGSHPIENAVALHVNTAVVPSGTGDGLFSVTSSDKLPDSVYIKINLNYYHIIDNNPQSTK